MKTNKRNLLILSIFIAVVVISTFLFFLNNLNNQEYSDNSVSTQENNNILDLQESNGLNQVAMIEEIGSIQSKYKLIENESSSLSVKQENNSILINVNPNRRLLSLFEIKLSFNPSTTKIVSTSSSPKLMNHDLSQINVDEGTVLLYGDIESGFFSGSSDINIFSITFEGENTFSVIPGRAKSITNSSEVLDLIIL